MKFYVSIRPLRIENRLYSPKEHLKHNFKGLDIGFNLVAINQEIDGRWLYEITISDSYTEQEITDYKAVILEGLQVFGVHEKTLTSAKALAEILTDKTWDIVDDHIEVAVE